MCSVSAEDVVPNISKDVALPISDIAKWSPQITFSLFRVRHVLNMMSHHDVVICSV